MSDIGISFSNADQLIAAFRKAPGQMQKQITNAVNKSLLLIGGSAAKKAPVLTGNLRSSILDPDRGLVLAKQSAFSGAVGSGVGYGAFVEFGTRFQRAQPYLGPAIDETHDQVQQFFTDAVNSVASQIARDSL